MAEHFVDHKLYQRVIPGDSDRLRVYRPQPSAGGAAGTRAESGRRRPVMVRRRATTATAAPAAPGRRSPRPVSEWA